MFFFTSRDFAFVSGGGTFSFFEGGGGFASSVGLGISFLSFVFL